MRIALDALNGTSLNVERSGAGPCSVVAIHGFTGSAATWESFIKAAGNEYEIICPELQGHGKSDSPDDPALYDINHTVRALDELTTRIGIKEAHWLGYSLGGRVALAAAISLNEKILSIMVESSSAGLDNANDRKARKAGDDALADKIEKGSIENFVSYWESQTLFGSQARLPSEERIKLRAERLANNVCGLANSLRGIGVGVQVPLYKELPRLAVPCLFVSGEEDAKFTGIAHRMRSLVIRGQVLVVAESGHCVHMEQPVIFNRAGLRFIRNVEQIPGISPVQPESRLVR